MYRGPDPRMQNFRRRSCTEMLCENTLRREMQQAMDASGNSRAGWGGGGQVLRVTTMPPIGCVRKKNCLAQANSGELCALINIYPPTSSVPTEPQQNLFLTAISFKRGYLQPSHRAGILVHQNQSWCLGHLVHDWFRHGPRMPSWSMRHKGSQPPPKRDPGRASSESLCVFLCLDFPLGPWLPSGHGSGGLSWGRGNILVTSRRWPQSNI